MKQYATYIEAAAVIVGNFGDKLGLGKYNKYTKSLAPAGGAILGKKLYQAVKSTSPAASNMAMRQASLAASSAWARGVRTQPGFEGNRMI
jgi:hypothetical protein